MKAPNGFAEIVAACGDPRDYLGPDGVMSTSELFHWEHRLGLVYVPFPEPLQIPWGRPGQKANALRCHPIAADPFRQAFATLAAEDLWRELKDFGGGFIVRSQRGSSSKFSTHAFGLAADFNVTDNPLGAPSKMPLSVVRVFESAGFKWGGDWTRVDAGHFQFATGY